MSRFHSYVNTTAQLLNNYKGEVPLAIYLKSFFSANKKYGSKDRKQISALCYNYYRIGNAIPQESHEQKILAAFFLCENEPSELLDALMPEWNLHIHESLDKKIFF